MSLCKSFREKAFQAFLLAVSCGLIAFIIFAACKAVNT